MTKKSSFERVHESSVALMREIAHTSGASRMLPLKNCEEPPVLSERRRADLLGRTNPMGKSGCVAVKADCR